MQPIIAILLFIGALGQDGPDRPLTQIDRANSKINNGSVAGTAPVSAVNGEYRVGSDDAIEISVYDVPTLAGVYKVGAGGSISLPLLGDIPVAGKTVREIREQVENLLRPRFVNDPHATVTVREFASQPVTIMGSVKNPGVYQLKGNKSLLDVIAMTLGLGTDAGKIQVMRRRSPSEAQSEDRNSFSPTITIDIEQFNKGTPELNIPIHSGDIINVQAAPPQTFFIVGEMNRPGEYPLRQGKTVTLTQALALGSGFSREAKKKECLIIRYKPDGSKEQIPIDMTKGLQSPEADRELMPNDILYIPAKNPKKGITRALDSVVSVAIGRAVLLGF